MNGQALPKRLIYLVSESYVLLILSTLNYVWIYDMLVIIPLAKSWHNIAMLYSWRCLSISKCYYNIQNWATSQFMIDLMEMIESCNSWTSSVCRFLRPTSTILNESPRFKCKRCTLQSGNILYSLWVVDGIYLSKHLKVFECILSIVMVCGYGSLTKCLLLLPCILLSLQKTLDSRNYLLWWDDCITC